MTERTCLPQRTARYASPLGELLLAGDARGLTGLWFEGQKHYARTLPADSCEGFLPVLAQTARWLDLYFSGAEPDFPVPLHPDGTPFQRAVWETLRTIPCGQTATYGQLAARLAAQRGGTRVSARAVGGAVGRNPISILIPCHRVLGADGSLTGYAGGLERKRRLLALEQAMRPQNGAPSAEGPNP